MFTAHSVRVLLGLSFMLETSWARQVDSDTSFVDTISIVLLVPFVGSSIHL